jgi:twitching motility two-component system response regulator PilH
MAPRVIWQVMSITNIGLEMKQTITIMTKLLVIEDSRFTRDTIKGIFAEAGLVVVDASDGEEGLQLARHSKPDLIILDMLLPKMAGELVLQSLKQDPTTANIPVIIVSSLPQSNAERLTNGGAIGYIEKSSLNLMAGGQNLLGLVNGLLKAKGRLTTI